MRRKVMQSYTALKDSLNAAFEREKKDAPWYQKKGNPLAHEGYQELEARVYQTVIHDELKDSPLLAEAFDKLLKEGSVATTAQLNSAAVTRRLTVSPSSSSSSSSVSDATRATRLVEITQTLLGWVGSHSPNTAGVRFIVGVTEAFCVAIQAEDHAKIEHFKRINKILRAVAASQLVDSWGVLDKARKAAGRAESGVHFKTQLIQAADTLDHIIKDEEIAQRKQAIRSHLGKINGLMAAIPTLLPSLTYNLYAEEKISNIHFQFMHRDNPQHVTSFVSVGLGQLGYLTNPRKVICYDATQQPTPVLNAVQDLNKRIQAVGNRTGNIIRVAEESKSPHDLRVSAQFIKNLREMLNQDRLKLGENGQICIDEVVAEGLEVSSIFSGFSGEILKDEELRNFALRSFIELLELMQELQNCLQLNLDYSRSLEEMGELSAFVMLDENIHRQMEENNLKVAQALHDKLVEIYKTFNDKINSNTTVNTFARGTPGFKRRAALEVALEQIVSIQEKCTEILGHAQSITRKREEAVRMIKNKEMSFLKAMERVISGYRRFSELQGIIGKPVLEVTQGSEEKMFDNAKAMDGTLQSCGQVAGDKKKRDDEKRSELRASEDDRTPSRSPVRVNDRSSPSLSPSSLDFSPRRGSKSSTGSISKDLNGLERKDNSPELDEKHVPRSFPPFFSLSPVGNQADDPHLLNQQEKFNLARVALGYQRYQLDSDPALLFGKYNLPPDQVENKENAIDYFCNQINLKNQIALTLESNMYNPWRWISIFSWPFWGEDIKNIKVARLILCQEMVDLFSKTIEDENIALSNENIETMYHHVDQYLKKQKQFLNRIKHSNFDVKLGSLQNKLLKIKNSATVSCDILREIDGSLKNKRENPDSMIAKVDRYFKQLEGFPGSAVKSRVIENLREYECNAFVKKLDAIKINKNTSPFGFEVLNENKNSDRLAALLEIGDAISRLEDQIKEKNHLSPALLASLELRFRAKRAELNNEIVKKLDDDNKQKVVMLLEKIPADANPFLESKEEKDVFPAMRKAMRDFLNHYMDTGSFEEMKEELKQILEKHARNEFSQHAKLMDEIIRELDLQITWQPDKEVKRESVEKKKQTVSSPTSMPQQVQETVMNDKTINIIITLAEQYISEKINEDRQEKYHQFFAEAVKKENGIKDLKRSIKAKGIKELSEDVRHNLVIFMEMIALIEANKTLEGAEDALNYFLCNLVPIPKTKDNTFYDTLSAIVKLSTIEDSSKVFLQRNINARAKENVGIFSSAHPLIANAGKRTEDARRIVETAIAQAQANANATPA